jgi:hypothetical protein
VNGSSVLTAAIGESRLTGSNQLLPVKESGKKRKSEMLRTTAVY